MKSCSEGIGGSWDSSCDSIVMVVGLVMIMMMVVEMVVAVAKALASTSRRAETTAKAPACELLSNHKSP